MNTMSVVLFLSFLSGSVQAAEPPPPTGHETFIVFQKDAFQKVGERESLSLTFDEIGMNIDSRNLGMTGGVTFTANYAEIQDKGGEWLASVWEHDLAFESHLPFLTQECPGAYHASMYAYSLNVEDGIWPESDTPHLFICPPDIIADGNRGHSFRMLPEFITSDDQLGTPHGAMMRWYLRIPRNVSTLYVQPFTIPGTGITFRSRPIRIEESRPYNGAAITVPLLRDPIVLFKYDEKTCLNTGIEIDNHEGNVWHGAVTHSLKYGVEIKIVRCTGTVSLPRGAYAIRYTGEGRLLLKFVRYSDQWEREVRVTVISLEKGRMPVIQPTLAPWTFDWIDSVSSEFTLVQYGIAIIGDRVLIKLHPWDILEFTAEAGEIPPPTPE